MDTGKLSIAVAMQGGQLSAYKREHGYEVLITTLSLLIRDLNDTLNIGKKMEAQQIFQTAKAIAREYWWIKLAELVYFFEQSKCNRYGKAYDRLDQAIIFEWLEKYVEERTDSIEMQHQERKEINNVRNWHPEVIKAVKAVLPEDTKGNDFRAGFDDPEYKAFKAQYYKGRLEKQQSEAQDNGEADTNNEPA